MVVGIDDKAPLVEIASHSLVAQRVLGRAVLHLNQAGVKELPEDLDDEETPRRGFMLVQQEERYHVLAPSLE